MEAYFALILPFDHVIVAAAQTKAGSVADLTLPVRIPIKPATDSTLKPATWNAPKPATRNDLIPATRNALKPAGPGALEYATVAS